MRVQNLDVLRTVRLRADQSTTVHIGLFESSIPTPEIDITSHPDINDSLGVFITKQDEDGDYILSCRLQNFSTQPCTVTIRSAE